VSYPLFLLFSYLFFYPPKTPVFYFLHSFFFPLFFPPYFFFPLSSLLFFPLSPTIVV
jgi:hypothetical protein